VWNQRIGHTSSGGLQRTALESDLPGIEISSKRVDPRQYRSGGRMPPSHLTRARTLDDWLAAPQGRFFTGRCFVTFCPEPSLFGFALWGRPGRADTEKLSRALLVELGPHAGPHRSLVDVRHVESVDGAAFEVLQRYVSAHHRVLKERVTSLALVRPKGLVGAVVAGFYAVLDSPYPTRDFLTLGEAAPWLGLDDETRAQIEGLVAKHSGVSPLLVELHACLDSIGVKEPMAAAARALGLAPRTLQRRLTEEGSTSFAREVMAHRLSVPRDAVSGRTQGLMRGLALGFPLCFPYP
jgi:hypothetical protein